MFKENVILMVIFFQLFMYLPANIFIKHITQTIPIINS